MQTATIDFSAARKAMIDSQLRTSGVNEPFVLERMNAVPREDFVPAAARSVAYIDRAIPLASGRHLAAPLFYGMVLAEAKPQADDRVLVVDGGAGYLVELLRPLVSSIDAIAPAEALDDGAGSSDITLLVIDGAVEVVPATLVQRLAPGARIVTGLAAGGVTRLATGQRSGDDAAMFALAEVGIPQLHEFDQPKGWSF